MEQVTCKEVVFIPATCNGVSGNASGKKIGNQWYTAIGFGYGENLFGSQLALLITIGGKDMNAWANPKFKEELLKINERVEARRVLLNSTMPKEVAVEEKISKRGTSYYIISEEDLEKCVLAH